MMTRTGTMKTVRLLMVVLTAYLILLTEGLWLNLPRSGEKCVSQEIHTKVLVVGDYVVIHEDGHPSSITVSAKVVSPSGTVLYHTERASHGQFTFTTIEGGQYVACFEVDGNRAGAHLNLDWKLGVDAKDWEAEAKKDKIELPKPTKSNQPTQSTPTAEQSTNGKEHQPTQSTVTPTADHSTVKEEHNDHSPTNETASLDVPHSQDTTKGQETTRREEKVRRMKEGQRLKREMAEKMTMESVDLELRKLSDIVESIYDDLLHLKHREEEMREISEETNARVALLSIMSLGICFVAGVLSWGFFFTLLIHCASASANFFRTSSTPSRGDSLGSFSSKPSGRNLARTGISY